MEKIKVDASLFGIKQPVSINGSIGELLKLDNLIKMSLDAAKAGSKKNRKGEDSFEKATTQEIEFYTKAVETVSEILNIKPDRVMSNLTPLTLGSYLGYLKARINGISEEEWNDSLTDNEEAPKEQTAKFADNHTK